MGLKLLLLIIFLLVPYSTTFACTNCNLYPPMDEAPKVNGSLSINPSSTNSQHPTLRPSPQKAKKSATPPQNANAKFLQYQRDREARKAKSK